MRTKRKELTAPNIYELPVLSAAHRWIDENDLGNLHIAMILIKNDWNSFCFFSVHFITLSCKL